MERLIRCVTKYSEVTGNKPQGLHSMAHGHYLKLSRHPVTLSDDSGLKTPLTPADFVPMQYVPEHVPQGER